MVVPSWTEETASVCDVRVWMSRLNLSPRVFAECYQSLSADEVKRYLAFGDRVAADAFVIRRGTIRHLLATYVEIVPSKIEIETDASGKPHMSAREVEFNVSSSRDLAIYAVSTVGEVGIDVEWIDLHLDYSSMLTDYFSDRERAAMAGKSAVDFFQTWVTKEACAKALGAGLSLPLASLEVMFSETVEVGRHGNVRKVALPVPDGYSAASAYGSLKRPLSRHTI